MMLMIITDFFNHALPFLDNVPIVRVFLGISMVFFIPGFAWSLVLLPGRKVNIIERITLSIGLSIALTTLFVLAANVLFDVKITATNSLVTIIGVTIIPLIWYFTKLTIKKGKNQSKINKME